MNQEIQHRKTFEVIAKWVCQKNNVTVEFKPNVTPHADIKNRRIVLPNNIKEENLDKVLALILHEAGHIARTWAKPEEIITCEEEMSVLNSAEDIRIDLHMMYSLPAIKRFYDELMKWEMEQQDTKAPFEHKVLCNIIRELTTYGDYNKGFVKEQQFITQHGLIGRLNHLKYLLENPRNLPTIKTEVKDITEIIYGKNTKRTPVSKQEDTQGTGKGDKPCPDCGGTGTCNGTAGGFGCGKFKGLFTPDPNAKMPLNEVSFEEQTQSAFNELLTIKSLKVVEDTKTLNTEDLTAFFRGDIDSLFIDTKIQRNKKSKILMLLDSSGSMTSNAGLADNKSRCVIVANVAKRIGEMIDEVHELEGINVDYDVRGFDTQYYKYDKDTWYTKYLEADGGGTYLDMAFELAQAEILADPTIDGNKIVIIITDGCVGDNQIRQVKELIRLHGEDVRCMILGVGMELAFQEQLGGGNIIAEKLADGIVLQAIEEMLG